MQQLNKWLGKVHAGDCLELMAKLPEGCIDVIVTSPPYNLGRNSVVNIGRPRAGPLMDGFDGHDDDMPRDQYVTWQRDCLSAMMRVLSEDGAIFYNQKWRIQSGLILDCADIVDGFPVRQIIIWHKVGGINFTPRHFLPTYEVIYLIAKPDFKLASKANGIGDVWRITRGRGNTHPAPFPVELPRRCIAATTAKIVLDPFCGSGTTGIAAELCGRDWIGMEQSEDYTKSANERIALSRLQKPLWSYAAPPEKPKQDSF